MTTGTSSVANSPLPIPESAETGTRIDCSSIPPDMDDTAAKPCYADWRAELAAIGRFIAAVVNAGMKQHHVAPSYAATDVMASVTDAILQVLSEHPDGDLSEAGIHAVVTAVIDAAGQYDTDNQGLAVMAALD